MEEYLSTHRDPLSILKTIMHKNSNSIPQIWTHVSVSGDCVSVSGEQKKQKHHVPNIENIFIKSLSRIKSLSAPLLNVCSLGFLTLCTEVKWKLKKNPDTDTNCQFALLSITSLIFIVSVSKSPFYMLRESEHYKVLAIFCRTNYNFDD